MSILSKFRGFDIYIRYLKEYIGDFFSLFYKKYLTSVNTFDIFRTSTQTQEVKQ